MCTFFKGGVKTFSAYTNFTLLFCENWDQASFDPEYESYPLEHFEPMVKRIFAKPIHDF